MPFQITADEIKETRTGYGMSQKTFADLLGIGVASIARYEAGAIPSRANTNLLHAAEDPNFMRECLEENGELLTDRQLKKARNYLDALSGGVEGGEGDAGDEASPRPAGSGSASYADDLQDFAAQQDALDELAGDVVCDLVNYLVDHGIAADDKTHPIAALLMQAALIKREIMDLDDFDTEGLLQLQGYFKYTQEYVSSLIENSQVGVD